uniref:Kisspeptin 1 n=1 Tax=Paramormyrops kingsleyae TaxID=1676925 RepID=A0A3B3S5H2_9TELE
MNSSMLFPTMLLMLAAGLREAYPSGSLQLNKDESPKLAFLKVLKVLDAASTTGPPPTVLSSPMPLQLSHSFMGARFHRRTWWYPEMAHIKAKKQQNLSSYNWNSFGLRYGKFDQKIKKWK